MDIPDFVRHEIFKLIPASIHEDVMCFALYDHHPKSDKNIDITICTKSGEIREYFQRDLHSSLNLNCKIKKPCELKILRNRNADMFYLLASSDDFFIISSKNKLKVHKKIDNIERYDINDASCSGRTILKVIKKDDAVPLLFDSNFESLDPGVSNYRVEIDETFPMLNDLQTKLVTAMYNTKCNEDIYARYKSLHQKVSLMSCQSFQPASSNCVYKSGGNEIHSVLNLKTQEPWVKVCNKRLVIMFNVLLQGTEPVEDIEVLLQTPLIKSLVYTTKIFTKSPNSPYWLQAKTTIMKPDQEIIISAVVDLDEIQQNSWKVELNGTILCKVGEREYMVPFDSVAMPTMAMFGDEIDVLSSNKCDEQTILAVLSSTEKTELIFRHIKNEDEQDISLLDLLCTNLQMDRVEIASNVLVYKKSPYHALNGTMMIFHENESENCIPVTVHTRTPEQVIVLLHYIHDAIPAKIIATTPTYKITSKTDLHSQDSEKITKKADVNCKEYVTSMLNRCARILEYLDASIIKMNLSKDPEVLSKLGSHIDLFATGNDNFKAFRDFMQKEAENGVKALEKRNSDEKNTNSDVIVIA